LLLTIILLKRKQLKLFFQNLKFGPEAILFFIASALVVWIFVPLFRGGLPASWDAAQHFVRCLVMKNIFLSNFRLDGWNPYWYLGYQQFLFYSPVLFFLVVMLNILTFQLVPLMICYKIFYFLLIFSLPFVCYWLLRQFKVDPFPSALAAVSVTSFSAIHGIGISAIFVAGLITQGFGLILFAFIIGGMLKICRPQSNTNDVLWLGLLIGVMLLSHIISAVYLAFCLIVLGVFNLTNHKNILKLAAAFLIGGLIASFAIYSAFAFRDLKLPAVGWGDFNFFQGLLTGAYFSTPLLNIIALFGFIIALFDKNSERRFLAVLAFFTYFLASGSLKINSGPLGDLYNQVLKHRTFPYLALYFIVFSGIFYQSLMNWVSNIAHRVSEKRDLVLKAAAIILAAIVVSHVYIKLNGLKDQIKTVAGYDDQRAARFYDALAWIKQNTPQNIVVTLDMRMDGAPDIFSFNYINIYADRYCLNGESGIRPDNIQFDMHLADWPPGQIYQDAVRYNVSYFMTWKEDAAANLLSDNNRFHLVYDNGTVKLWQVMGHDFRYIVNDDVKINKFHFSPEEINWSLLNNKELNRVICAVSYHPNWRLRLNGREEKIGKTDDRLMTFILPAKGAHYDVRLKFERSNPEKLLYLISAVTLLIVVGLIFKPFIK
jgi:hypothetical protein